MKARLPISKTQRIGGGRTSICIAGGISFHVSYHTVASSSIEEEPPFWHDQ